MSTGRADLVVRGGRIVSPWGTFEGGVAARDGIIVAVGEDRELPPAHEVIDAAGRYVLPGVIDCHVHLREPGYEYKEDWRSGTAAAACGGVTTVFDMPNTLPTTADAEGFRAKDTRASRGAYVDYGIYGLVGQENVGELERLAELGVIGFKCYMGETTGKIPPPDDGTMLAAFEIVGRLGMRVAVHAENDPILQHLVRRLKAAGRTDPLAHVESRPDVCAVEAVGRAIAIAEAAHAPLHILHESCRGSLPIIRAAKARGVDVTAETCPHYLLLTAEDMVRLGPVLRVNPPVRFAGHSEALWDGLFDGTLDMLATDHAPHTPEEKTQPNIWDGHSGFPGVDCGAADAERGEPGTDDDRTLRGMVGGGPGARLGTLPAQGKSSAGLGCRHGHRRHGARARDPRLRAPFEEQDHALRGDARPRRARVHHRAGPHRRPGR